MFSSKLYKFMAVAAMAILLLTRAPVTPVSAAAAPSTDPGNAAGPLVGSLRIEPGAVQWYKFKYKYDDSQKDNNTSEAAVLLKMDAAECVGFDVETPGTLATPAGEKHYPIGRGSPLTKKLPDRDPANEAKNADDAEDTNDDGKIEENENPYVQEPHGVVKNEQVLVWVGGGRATETFYVAVKNHSTAACDYQLTISGPTVSFPSVVATPAATPVATAQPAKSK
ncbi:MAG: hypothetical protein NT075_05975 [Chloroflexi bacterium]|nr:hypothetical protein [Chloroflexota bacterium]